MFPKSLKIEKAFLYFIYMHFHILKSQMGIWVLESQQISVKGLEKGI